MNPIAIDKARDIVEDFAKAIQERKLNSSKPSKTVINFRNEKIAGTGAIEREIVEVPIELLRYRKENGRIASDVTNYEKSNGLLDEKSDDCQKILREFLENKDPEKTEILTKSIEHGGQDQPAIITCDGFLINGNRRKMVFERLNQKHPGKNFAYLKVVILPGKGEPGGPPTLKEIEQLENRYQLQSEGKSEYYGFDRALSIKRKIGVGFSLEEQLRDDPRYANLSQKDLDQVVKEYQRDYLQPLECADRYLRQFNREGLYGTVSAGQSDSAGRWQAFIDYSNAFSRNLNSEKWRIENGVPEDEIGSIEEAAFKMIRLREIKDQGKIHEIMRKIPKICANSQSRKEILGINDKVENDLTKDEHYDKEGNPLPIKAIDAKWGAKYQQDIIYSTKRALEIIARNEEKEGPLTLLEAALKKLNHDALDLSHIRLEDLKKAGDLARKIQQRANELEKEAYRYEKNWEALVAKRSARR